MDCRVDGRRVRRSTRASRCAGRRIAPAPADSSSKEWVGFSVAQTGQMEKADTDKAVIRHIIRTCEDEQLEAHVKAAKGVKPCYRRIL